VKASVCFCYTLCQEPAWQTHRTPEIRVVRQRTVSKAVRDRTRKKSKSASENEDDNKERKKKKKEKGRREKHKVKKRRKLEFTTDDSSGGEQEQPEKKRNIEWRQRAEVHQMKMMAIAAVTSQLTGSLRSKETGDILRNGYTREV